MKSTTKVVLLIMTAVMALSLVGCGGTTGISKPPQTGDDVAVSGEVSAQINGNEIAVTGSTDIMDGAVYAITLDKLSGENLYKHVMTKAGDEFTHTIPIDANWSGDVYVNVVFAPSYNGGQSEEVIAKYGERFANLSGDGVIFTMEGNCFVAQSEELTIG